MAPQLMLGRKDEKISWLSSASVRIGNISLAVSGNCDVSLNAGLERFLSKDCSSEIEVAVKWTPLRPCAGMPAFDSGAVWKLFRFGDELMFDFGTPTIGPDPYKRMVTNRTFRSASLYFNSDLRGRLASTSPLEYPADELLFTNYLAVHGLGVEVHGCGLIDAETGGHLLLGHSGAGKSTTARLWQTMRNPEILSDDRIILRIEDGELWMYGTPWHGEGQFASPGKAKLHRVLILQHGRRNEMIEMSRASAAAELFARCFPPFHSSEGLERAIEFLHRVVDVVPCYEFRFVPDGSAVKTVIEMEHAAAAA